jgi:hypothetical protein
LIIWIVWKKTENKKRKNINLRAELLLIENQNVDNKKSSVQRSGYQRFDDSYNYDFQIFILGEIINDI